MATGDPLKNYPAIHRIIGRPDLTESRLQMDREEYYGIIRDAMLTKPAAEWIRLGNAEDIPIVPMNHFSDISEDPQAWANGFVEHVAFPSGNTDVMPASPIEMNSADVPPTMPSPEVGAHTVQILQALGYSQAQIEQMLAAGAAVAAKEETK